MPGVPGTRQSTWKVGQRLLGVQVAMILFLVLRPFFSAQFALPMRQTKRPEQCAIGVVMGASMDNTRALYASIYSVIQSFSDDRQLCIFIFASPEDYVERKASLECTFSDERAAKNVRFHVKLIRKENWKTNVFTDNGLGRKELNSDYNWFRFHLLPHEIGGLNKFVWLDTDIIVRGNVADLYDWDLHGNPVAGGVYDEPLSNQLCKENSVELNKIRMTKDMLSPLDLRWNMNAGLLVFDMVQMEKQGIMEEWARLKGINDVNCIWKIQQSAFTLAIHGNFEKLPSEWNLGSLGWMEGFTRQIGEAAAKRHIDSCAQALALHWNGRKKPWIDYGMEEGAACADVWREYDIVALHNKLNCVAQ